MKSLLFVSISFKNIVIISNVLENEIITADFFSNPSSNNLIKKNSKIEK
jgi:hypothetical protein